MSRTRTDIERAGAVILCVTGGHMLLGALFLVSRPPVIRTAPVSTTRPEIWILPLPAHPARNSGDARFLRHMPPVHEMPGDRYGPQAASEGTQNRTEMPPDTVSLEGQERLGRALRHGQDCRKALMDGTTLPPDCPSRGYVDAKPLPVKPGKQTYWDAQVSANEAARRYKSDPGNVDYWKRVNGPDSPRYTPPDLPAPGVYSTEKQQMMHDVDARNDDYYRLKRDGGPTP
ncbi:MAG: hypothetical protein QM667_01055 [Asticcacaulis sp.]